MTYRAVLFDLDGTLLDTIEDLTDSMNAALAALGLPGHETAACKYFVGDGVVNFARRALPADHRDKATVARCVARMREEYARRWRVKTRPYDGVPELLDELTARGLPFAVLSNKPDDVTSLAVRELLGRWRFAAVRGVRADGVTKPDPAGALEIAAAMSVPPGEVLYVGDTNTDMVTAGAAGMFPVGATWGFRTPDELLESGAEVLIHHPTELLRLL